MLPKDDEWRIYYNLRAEMARYGLKTKDIAKALGLSTRSVLNKMHRKTVFTLDEAFLIRNTFFPKMSLDDLFSDSLLKKD